MRSRKELIYLNIKDLTPEEIAELGNMELNCCDNCGEIDLSIRLHWIDSEEFWDDKYCAALVSSGICAICEDCYLPRNSKISKCKKCDKYFLATGISTQPATCPHCKNESWVYGGFDK
jgi:hypothetical protein